MAPQSTDIQPSALEGYADVAEILGDRQLHQFSYVHSFLFIERQDILGNIWRDIDLVLSELDPPHRKIGFHFHRAVVETYSGFGQIMGLCIQSIKERGWETLHYEVGDYENGSIHLFCHSVTLYAPTNIA